MKLTVKTHQEATGHGEQLLAEYRAKQDRRDIDDFERYELTEAGRRLLAEQRKDTHAP